MVNMSHTATQDEVISAFEYYAGLAEELDRTGDEDLHVPDENMQITVRREPLGVCALITPWNVSACKQFPVSRASQTSPFSKDLSTARFVFSVITICQGSTSTCLWGISFWHQQSLLSILIEAAEE